MSLDRYRAKRHPDKTPEPVPDTGGTEVDRTATTDTDVDDTEVDHTGDDQGKRGDSFVVQEHHATALHWDVRLERDGVLVSWAVPKGLPLDPSTNHLAKQTEDHPLGYATFAGEIPRGEYGGGSVTIWDRGTYELEKWQAREVKVVLHGGRVEGRYVFFRTRGQDWMVHRMDAPPAGWAPLPQELRPMLATAGTLPRDDEHWSYEVKWDGVRVLVAVDGGRLRVTSRNGNNVTRSYPELRGLGLQLGSRQVLLDGEVVAFNPQGRTDFGLLQARMHVAKPGPALLRSTPVQLLAFDLLHADGGSLLGRPYDDRRAALEALQLQGEHWQVPEAFRGGGTAVLEATRVQGLEGIVAKRRDSPYRPGRRSDSWRKIKHVRRTSAVVAGWKPGEGSRSGRIGSLLLGVQGEHGLEYAGNVGTGFTATTLRMLGDRMEPLRRADSPFAGAVPRAQAKEAVWVDPVLVVEVDYTEWTKDGRMRHPSYKGLRDDYGPEDVVRE